MWEEDMPSLEAEVRRHQSWGYPVRMVGRDAFATLEPRVATPLAAAAYSECEGRLDCPEAIRILLAAAEILNEGEVEMLSPYRPACFY